MPKVKRKTAKRSAKNSRKAKQKSGPFSGLSEFAMRYATAGAAGATVIGAIGVFLLWSGGYFGLLGEKFDRVSGDAAVAAGMQVKRITAKGLEHTGEDEILGAVGDVIGASMVHFDPFRAQARVEELGWVRSAAVSRLWPDTVHVSIREREPAAVWQMSGDLHLIDQSGAVIGEIDAYEYSNLPLIVGAGAPATASGMLKALRAEPALWGAASALIRVGDRRWNLRLKSGADIKFPEVGYRAAVRDLAALHTAYGLLDRPIEYVDLRDPNRLVYREKGAAESTLSVGGAEPSSPARNG